MAWNRVKLNMVDVEEKRKLLSEVELLERLRHVNILRFLKYWITEGTGDANGSVSINFITELCSDNLRKCAGFSALLSEIALAPPELLPPRLAQLLAHPQEGGPPCAEELVAPDPLRPGVSALAGPSGGAPRH